MTNKEWLLSLDEFERAVVCVNFGRTIPQVLHGNEKFVREYYEKWLTQCVNKDNLYKVMI